MKPPIHAAPTAPLTTEQQRMLSNFNRMSRGRQEFMLRYSEALAIQFPAAAPKRAFTVIEGGAS